MTNNLPPKQDPQHREEVKLAAALVAVATHNTTQRTTEKRQNRRVERRTKQQRILHRCFEGRPELRCRAFAVFSTIIRKSSNK